MNMRRLSIMLVLIAVLFSTGSLGSTPARAGEGVPNAGVAVDKEFAPGQIVIKFASAEPAEMSVAAFEASQAVEALQVLGGSRLRTIKEDPRLQLWSVPQGKELELASAMSAHAGVVYAEPNSVYRADVVPNDPGYPNQWAHPKINSPAAWDVTTGSNTIVIAVIDTGIDLTHPEFSGKLVTGYDFYWYDTTPDDENGHGTHVAGIAAASTNNSTGVAGMSWGAKIMPIKALGADGSGYNFDITSGILYAKNNGADIINLSLGGSTNDGAMQDAVNQAHAAGALVVAAMGNANTSSPAYPAAFNNVMAVSATAPDDSRASYSNYGPHVDIAAPGGQMGYLHDPDGIYSTMPTYNAYLYTQYGYSKNYDYLQGTSQATPYVAGLAALIWSASPGLSNDQVQSVIQNTAVDLGAAGWDNIFGWGRINAGAALASLHLSAATLDPIANPELDGSYTVNWNDVTNATSYTLEEDDNAGFTSPSVRYTGGTSQYAIMGQGPGIWYYRVRAGNATLQSDWSNTQSAGVAPAAPTLNAISNPAPLDVYTVTWGTVSGAAGYELQEANNTSFTGATTRYMGSSTSYAVTGQAGGTWYYRVRGYNIAGNGPFSGSQSTSVPAAPLSAPDVLPIANPSNTGAYTVNWTSVGGASGYIVEETRDPYFIDTTVVYSGTATSLPVTGQLPGGWGYRVRANSAGGMSAWSLPEFTDVIAKIRLPLIVR